MSAVQYSGEERSILQLGDSKLLQSLPKTEAFTGYRVQIDDNDYFELDGFILRLHDKEIRIFNLRSIRGHIGVEFTRKGDGKLQDIIKRYLTHSDNVELLNILSREINDFNWFDAYNDNFIDIEVYTKEELMGMKNSCSGIMAHMRHDDVEEEKQAHMNMSGTGYELQEEKNNVPMKHGAYAPCSSGDENIVSIDVFINEVRSTKNDHLLPQALMNHLHEGIIPYVKHSIDDFDYFPIWYINGARTSKADLCELYCPLEVIIHILSKRFVQFKAKLLTLASTDVQLAVAQGEKLDDYTSFRKHQLIEACHAKDDKIDKLTNVVINQTEKITVLVQKNNELLKSNEDLHQENKELKEDMDTLKNMHTESMEMVRLGYRDLKYLSNRVEIADEHILETKQDIRSVSRVAHRLAKELSKQNITNTSTGTIKFKLYFYLSDHVPKNEDKRLDIPYDEIWIGCGCGEKNNVKSNMPEDRDVIYKREINSRDVYQFIVDNSPNFIIETNYRHIRIKISQTGAFFNHVDELMHTNSQHASVIHLERIEAIIKTREEKRLHEEIERKHNEELEKERDQTLIRKQEVFDELGQETHIFIGRISRKVYGGFNDEVLSVNSEWIIRYDRGGSRRRALTVDEIINGKFTSQHDARTKYED